MPEGLTNLKEHQKRNRSKIKIGTKRKKKECNDKRERHDMDGEACGSFKDLSQAKKIHLILIFEFCMLSFHQGHANLLCLIPILSEVSEETT